jgi:hypothetical protein
MNNERPMDILDAIINKKLYKIGTDNQHQAPPAEMSFALSPRDAAAAFNDVFGPVKFRPQAGVATRALDREASSPPQAAPPQAAPPQAAPPQAAPPQAAPAAGAAGGRETEDNSPWKEASFFAGVGNDKFAVLNTRDNIEDALRRIGINLGERRINVEPGKAALLELSNGTRVIAYSDANGNKQLIISDPEKLGARVPGNNLQALPPAMYSLVYRNHSNDNNAALGATQGVQSYDPTQLVQQLLAALIQAINASGSNNNVLGNNWANSILSNIPITPMLGS